MGFKKLMASMGAGSASVDTVLQQSNVAPGDVIRGEVNVKGGAVDQDIEQVAVQLVARVEVESGDTEYQQDVPFSSKPVAGRFELDDNDRHSFPFEIEVPWETPITTIFGQHLRGMSVGVKTRVAIKGGVDAGDLDPVSIQALPAQQAVLDAFGQLGFRFMNADLELGRLHRVQQQLPFYQEIEFAPSGQFASAMNQLEVTFVAGPQSMEMVIEVDKRGGLFMEGQDTFGRFTVDYASLGQTNWSQTLHDWFTQVGQRRGFF